MKLHRKIYIAESVQKKQFKIQWKLKENQYVAGVYVIMLSTVPGNLLDIVRADELQQSWYKKTDLTTVGIAGNYGEAVELVRTMIEDIYRKTGAFDVAAFFPG